MGCGSVLRPSRICAFTALILSRRSQARRCLPAIETFEEEDHEGIDDTDEGDEEGRRSFENCVGSYAWLWETQDFDWTSLAGRSERQSKTTVALIIGYLGHKFVGLQQPCQQGRTDFVRAVETELELALFKAGAMIPENFGNLCRLRWSRVGRTDAGVSASCNVVSGRLIVGKDPESLEELVQRIRSFLPADLAIHGAAFVSKRFSARREGCRRAYEFLVPSFCVAPTRAKTRTWLAARRPDVMPTDFTVEDLKLLEEELKLREVRLSAEQLKRFRRALAAFEGTHFFGNFANKKLDPRGPQGYRHVRRCHGAMVPPGPCCAIRQVPLW